jgi:RNA polymerase-binding protein DksA
MAMDAPQIPIDPVDPREALTAERSRVLEQLKEIAVEAPGQMTYGSQAAAASHVFEQQRDLALRDHDQQHLAAIDAALARLDAGTYGACTSCKRPIPTDRLEALPWTALCIDCSRTTRRR